MACRAVVPRVLSILKVVGSRSPCSAQQRHLSLTAQRRTDGVFRALTNERISKPWIQAFRERQQQGENAPSKGDGSPQTPANRDLTPKKMSDSYHSVVGPLRDGTIASPLTDPQH